MNEIELSLHYDGEPFEPPSPSALSAPEELRESGYGLPLIYALCDEFNNGQAQGANTNRLVFYPAAGY